MPPRKRGWSTPAALHAAVKRAMVPLEYPIQCSIVQAAQWELAEPPEVVFCSVPNGFYAGKDGAKEWAKLEKAGALKGFNDLQFFWPVRMGLFMEVKRPEESPEPHQSKIHEHLRHQGWIVVVVDNLDDARKAWRDAGIPHKGTRLPSGAIWKGRPT